MQYTTEEERQLNGYRYPNGSMSGEVRVEIEKMLPPFKDEWYIINGIPTYVLKLGDIQPDVPLVVILPGNPGVANYYEEFMLALHEKSGYKLSIWCISHAGHVNVPEDVASKNPHSCYLNLEDQLQHKCRYIQDFIPADTKLILIGHSIGAYMLLQVVKKLKPERLVKGILLFPTIEKMADSPKGSFLKPVLQYCSWVVVLATYPVYCFLPHSARRMLAKWYFRGSKVPDCSIEATVKLVNPRSVTSVFTLGVSELEQVKELQHDIIRSNIDKLMFYYGQGDPWCPVQYYHDMKKNYPEADIRLCTRNMEHAFVLEYSKPMAEVLWEWMVEKMPFLSTNR